MEISRIVVEKNEYLIEEAEYTRQTILFLIDKLQELERYALLTTGAIWSWAIANSQAQGIRLLWWSPLIIQSLFALRALVTWKNLSSHLEYLSEIEKEIMGEGSFGLGAYLQKKWGKLPGRSGALFWVLLIVITFLINLLLSFK